MSLNRPKKIDLSDVDHINMIQSLGEFLCKFDIKATEELLETCDEILTEDFCSDCGSHVDCCNCGDENIHGRYMREYDDGVSLED